MDFNSPINAKPAKRHALPLDSGTQAPSVGVRTDTAKPKAKRTTRLAGQITKLAQSQFGAAILLARTGKVLSPLEDSFSMYFETGQELAEVKAGKRKFQHQVALEISGPKWSEQQVKEEIRASEYLMEKLEKELSNEFIFALRNKDFAYMKLLVKTAEAMASFKKEPDSVRHMLLILKKMLDHKGRKIGIRAVAAAVQWPEAKSSDGFSGLRRICKELKFPLARTR